MEITDEIVDHIAHLARLEFNGEEKQNIKADLTKVIGFVDQIKAVDKEGVDPVILMKDGMKVLREGV